MKIAVRIAQAGNQILNIIVMGIILFLFLYGGYSLWDTYMSAKSAFLSDDLLSYKPQMCIRDRDSTLLVWDSLM